MKTKKLNSPRSAEKNSHKPGTAVRMKAESGFKFYGKYGIILAAVSYPRGISGINYKVAIGAHVEFFDEKEIEIL